MTVTTKEISPKRRFIMAKTTLTRHARPEYWGAIECSTAAQLCHSLMYSADKDRTAPADLKALAAETMPLLKAAAREAFTAMPEHIAHALINASADVCIYAKNEAIDGDITPLSYLYAIYLWLDAILERGPERGGLVMGDGCAFDIAWQRIRDEMLKYEEELPNMERSCRKRARRFQEAFERFGLFVDQTAQQVAA
ncbi:hypothetical protein [Azospirillum sp.]|uniref:hypothetical protein n=1 Tax=Azospirillum sp. TaxID=34012 RepID=UPI003D726900